MIREVRNIQRHMQAVITTLYERFLTDSAQVEELEYGTYAQELTANFVHKAYTSMADLRHCAAFDIASLRDRPGFDVMVGLHAETTLMAECEEALAA